MRLMLKNKFIFFLVLDYQLFHIADHLQQFDLVYSNLSVSHLE